MKILGAIIFALLVPSHSTTKISGDLKKFSEDELSQACLKQLEIVNQNLSLFWRLFDSSSKYPSSGMSYSNNRDFGNFDECVDLKYESQAGNLKGKYCALSVAIINLLLEPVPNPFPVQGKHLPEVLTPTNSSMKLNSSRTLMKDDLPVSVSVLSICVPDACTPKEVSKYYGWGNIKLMNISLINVVESFPCMTKDSNTDFEPRDIIYITFLSIILLLLVCSTVYDYYLQKVDKKASHPLYLAFSVMTNGKKLLHTSNNSSGQIQCLNGMRFISMMWVIAGHGFGLLQMEPLVNYSTIDEYLDNIKVQYITSAGIAVDTFFFLSGFLLTFGYLKASVTVPPLKQATRVPMMYLHRYLRLTPAAAVLFWAMISIFRIMGTGPLWDMVAHMARKPCEKYWWSFFLYVQNYVNYGEQDMCLSQTWYLSADMQMFLLAPLVLIPLTILIKKEKSELALIFLSCLTAICVVIPMIVRFTDESYNNNYDTHSRLNDYLIGVILGVILRKYKKFPFSKIVNLIIWCCVLIICVAFNIYYHDVLLHSEHTKDTLFYGLYRPVWCASLAWMVYSCYHGYGGPINWFLSLPAFQIGGRLSYCMYLLHIPVQLYWMGTFRTSFYWSDYTIFYNWCGHFIITMVLSAIWTLAFESPMIVIERFLFGNTNRKAPQKQEQP